MSLVINTNVASLNSQRQLMQSGNALDQATERLSSGNRINSAKDDAAGLAIANRMTSQIRGLDQAIRNANDGVSMIQTAEGALQEVTNILQRIGELAVQSANEIYNDGDREYLQSEVTQLIEELDRISSSTSFNGQKLLDGTLGAVNLQVGSEANQVMTVEVGAMDAKTLGGDALGDIVGSAMTFQADVEDWAGDNGILNLNGSVTINDTELSAGLLNGASTVNELLEVINDNVDRVTASAVTEVVGDREVDGVGVTGVISGGNSMDFTVYDADGKKTTFSVSNTDSLEDLAATINTASNGTVNASISDDGELVLSNRDGASIDVAYTDENDDPWANGAAATGIAEERHDASLVLDSNDGRGVTITYGAVDDPDNPDEEASALLRVEDSNALGIDVRENVGEISGQAIAAGDVGALAAGDLTINGVAIGAISAGTRTGEEGAHQAENVAAAINKMSAETGVTAKAVDGALTLKSSTGEDISIAFKGNANQDTTGLQATNAVVSFDENVANIDISTAAGAQRAIDTIDRALNTISETRADLGAINNRLDFTIANLANVSEKTSAARARIMDADFAAETANLSRAQVLQQAATAMLAQANARPQQVLQLLQ